MCGANFARHEPSAFVRPQPFDTVPFHGELWLRSSSGLNIAHQLLLCLLPHLLQSEAACHVIANRSRVADCKLGDVVFGPQLGGGCQ